MTDVTTSDDVLAVETLDDFVRMFESDGWTNWFVISVTTADSDGKHAKVEASYTVMLMPPIPDGEHGLVIKDEVFRARRAFIVGHAASYYLGESGRGHLALSKDLKLALCYDRRPKQELHRIDRVAMHRVVNVQPLLFEATDIAQAS